MDKFVLKTPRQPPKPSRKISLSRNSPNSNTPAKSPAKKKCSPVKKVLQLGVKIKTEQSSVKRYHTWKDSYLVQYKWLSKVGEKVFCKCCSKFPALHHKNSELVKGWPGNKEGFKPEMFARHSLYHNKSNHNECEKSYDKLMSGAPMIASVCPDISTFGSRISKSLKEQLSAKIVCANVVATEGMSDTKYKPILDSYEILLKSLESTLFWSSGGWQP